MERQLRFYKILTWVFLTGFVVMTGFVIYGAARYQGLKVQNSKNIASLKKAIEKSNQKPQFDWDSLLKDNGE